MTHGVPHDSPQQESFVQECECLSEELQSNSLIIEGEYTSEKTMRETWGWTEKLAYYLWLLLYTSACLCSNSLETDPNILSVGDSSSYF